MDTLLQDLQKRKGSLEGSRIFRTIMPGILADFRSMLSDAAPGTTVREEYRIDDGSGVVVMEGRRSLDGKMEMEGRLM